MKNFMLIAVLALIAPLAIANDQAATEAAPQAEMAAVEITETTAADGTEAEAVEITEEETAATTDAAHAH